MPGDVGDFSVNIGLGINFLAFVSQFVTLRDTLTCITTAGRAWYSLVQPGTAGYSQVQR